MGMNKGEIKTMKTLKELADKYAAEYCIILNAGNGCGEPEAVDIKTVDDTIEMEVSTDQEVIDAYTAVIGEASEQLFASAWITEGEGDNPYRYRVIL